MISLRRATAADADAIAGIEIETWRTTYAGLLPDGVLLGMSHREHAAAWGRLIGRRVEDVMVATGPQGCVGFGSCGVQRLRALAFAGEIYTLYVQPDHQGAGVGRLLLHGLFARLLAGGAESAVVWVVRANPSRFFYEHLGGSLVSHRPIPVGGEAVEALAYGWRDLRTTLKQALPTHR